MNLIENMKKKLRVRKKKAFGKCFKEFSDWIKNEGFNSESFSDKALDKFKM